jgi:hypothetical protein
VPAGMSSATELISPEDQELVADGQEAAQRVKRSLADWITIGKAVDVGKRYCMRITGKNQPRGKAYCTSFSKWLTDNGFNWIGKTTRAKLLAMMDELPEVEDFLAKLDDDERRDIKDPVTLMARFAKKPPQRNGEEKAPSPYRKLENVVRELEEQLDQREEQLQRAIRTEQTAVDIAAKLVATSPEKARLVAKEIEMLLSATAGEPNDARKNDQHLDDPVGGTAEEQMTPPLGAVAEGQNHPASVTGTALLNGDDTDVKNSPKGGGSA